MVDYFIDYKKTSTQTLPKNNRPKLFLFGIASFPNMGDQAIALAIKNFFETEYPNFQYIGIMDYDTKAAIKEVSSIITSQDIVGYVGGGSIGVDKLQIEIERHHREVFSTFIHNLTLSFPSSVHFEDSAYGRKEAENSGEAYGKNKHLVIFVRDAQSYRWAQNIFENPVVIIPDMVLYLKQKDFHLKRSGALLVLRRDIEGIVTEKFVGQLKDAFQKTYGSIPEIDTTLHHIKTVTPETSKEILEKLLKKFAGQKLILTDRFHAMVFCAITGTPCVLFGNTYGKGKHAYYDWLDHIPWVIYTDSNDLNYIENLAHKVTSAKVYPYNLRKSFRPLRKIIDRHLQKHDLV